MQDPPQKGTPYFEVVARTVWSNYTESSAGSTIATARDPHARQDIDDDPNKQGYPGPLGWALGVKLQTPHHPKICC